MKLTLTKTLPYNFVCIIISLHIDMAYSLVALFLGYSQLISVTRKKRKTLKSFFVTLKRWS